MQDSNTKRGARNDRRANNRGANAPKEAAAPRARRENAAPARGSNAQPKFDPHFRQRPGRLLRCVRHARPLPLRQHLSSAAHRSPRITRTQTAAAAAATTAATGVNSAMPAPQSRAITPALPAASAAMQETRAAPAAHPVPPKAEPARRGRNAAARDEDPGADAHQPPPAPAEVYQL